MAFKKPTEIEAKEYAQSIKYYSFDYNVWCNYYELRNWTPSGSRKQMTNWRLAINTFFHKSDDYKKTKTAKTKLFPITGKVCSKRNCGMPAIYKDSSGAYDSYKCGDHLPEKVKEKYCG